MSVIRVQRLLHKLVLLIIFSPGPIMAQGQGVIPDFLDFKNFFAFEKQMGLQNLYSRKGLASRRIRLAIFDNSFEGWEAAKGRTLPNDTYFDPGPLENNQAAASPHGLKMAEIAYAFATANGRRPEFAPQFLLLRADGFTNFRHAINEAIRLKVDIISHSITREFGSNFDGRGIYNTEVNRAINAGIIWINNAGNFRKTTYNLNRIQTKPDPQTNEQFVEIPDSQRLVGARNSVPIQCRPLAGRTDCAIKIVLSWNSFSDTVEMGTDKDLDLVLTDDTKNVIGGSFQTQRLKPSAQGETLYPRELIDVVLNKGRYFLRIKDRSGNFTERDQLRIVGWGEGLHFELKDEGENVLNPADNPAVLTVGAWDSEISSRSRSLNKPELETPSILEFGPDLRFAGSSNSAAITAGIAALLMSDGGAWSKARLLEAMTGKAERRSTPSPPIAPLRPEPTGGGSCYLSFPEELQTEEFKQALATLAPQLKNLNAQLGDTVIVDSTDGPKLMTLGDWGVVHPGARRYTWSDHVFVTPQGPKVVSRSVALSIRASGVSFARLGWLEVMVAHSPLQMPCEVPETWVGHSSSMSVPKLKF